MTANEYEACIQKIDRPALDRPFRVVKLNERSAFDKEVNEDLHVAYDSFCARVGEIAFPDSVLAIIDIVAVGELTGWCKWLRMLRLCWYLGSIEGYSYIASQHASSTIPSDDASALGKKSFSLSSMLSASVSPIRSILLPNSIATPALSVSAAKLRSI